MSDALYLSTIVLWETYPLGLATRHYLQLWLFLAGYEFGTGSTAGVSVVERNRQTQHLNEYEIAVQPHELRSLAALLERTGLPGRSPRVEPVVDTSDYGGHLLLSVSNGPASRTFDLCVMSSSFEGEDAAALHSFFARLFALAGVSERTTWYDLARCHPPQSDPKAQT